MASFRKFSEKYTFLERSQIPEIAVELSLQPWKTFGVDGVIMFSDILTPLPMLGIEFDIVSGHGPVIRNPITTPQDIIEMSKCQYSPESQLPYIKTILQVSLAVITLFV
jgi:uroporphyrinogen decarboxylase